MPDLPAELWTQVFDLAADEDVIFQHGLPTSMAESAWFKDFFGEWALRSPADALNLVQRRSYVTKKAIVRTCKKWRTLGAEFLFRCLFFNDTGKLLALCALLDSSSAASTTATNSLGWWTRRIHLTRFYTPSTRGTTPEALQDALTSIIRHCANLEIFIVDWPMAKHAFGPIADALATYTKKSLRTLSISVPASALPKVIWALDALPNVFAAHIELEAPTSDVDLPDANADADETPLGAAHNIHLRLPRLAQLSLRGPHLQQFLEQATGWALPSLRHLSIDCASGRADTPAPDTLSFLKVHGAPLLFLDLSAPRALPIRRILAACPALRTLAFNADWRVVDHSATDDDAEEGRAPFAHDHIANVGLHGLAYAFGVGYTAAAADATLGISIPHILATSANDRTLAALLASPPSSSSSSSSSFSEANNSTNARFFPALTRIRVLSRPLLLALNKADGPAPGEGMGRWERWWGAAAAAGIRLEDCTGGLLGVLPQDADADPSLCEDSDEGEGGEEGEADEEGDWEYAEGEDEDADTDADDDAEKPGNGLRALRALLEECRAMDAGRDERYVFEDPEVRAMFPAVDVPETEIRDGGGAGAGPEIRVTPPGAGDEAE